MRKAYGVAGMGCRKKRMPLCNEADTGLKVTWCEIKPTSDRSVMARKFVESTVMGESK